MKQRFSLHRLDELVVFLLIVLSVLMFLWNCLPYSAESLQKLVERQSFDFPHCYWTTDDDTAILRDPPFSTHTVVHEEYARGACASIVIPRANIHVLSASRHKMIIAIQAPLVEVEYGKTSVFEKEGTLPLDKRIALSTKLKRDLGVQCDNEVRKAVRENITTFIHSLSPRTTVRFELSPTDWCGNGPVGNHRPNLYTP